LCDSRPGCCGPTRPAAMSSVSTYSQQAAEWCPDPGHAVVGPRWCPTCSKTVNRVTTAPREMADTSTMGRTVRPSEGKQMFTTNTFESNLTKIIAAALALAFVASLVS